MDDEIRCYYAADLIHCEFKRWSCCARACVMVLGFWRFAEKLGSYINYISAPSVLIMTELIIFTRVLRYSKQAPAQGLFFSASASLSLQAFCDADWAAAL